MTTKNSLIFISHILESIEKIETYSNGVAKEQFITDTELQDAIMRRIEIIGEAVKNIPRDIKEKYNRVKWKEISGTRDILIHHYFGVDLELTWKVVKKDIPILKKQMERIKKENQTK